MGYYGASIGASIRIDLAAAYGRLMGEVGEFASDGASIMIRSGWIEKPPSSLERRKLAKG
ncbi:MAG: DUF3231 family protein [Bacillota bacterium]